MKSECIRCKRTNKKIVSHDMCQGCNNSLRNHRINIRFKNGETAEELAYFYGMNRSTIVNITQSFMGQSVDGLDVLEDWIE